MGLFDFIRNIGKSVAPGKEADDIKTNITTLLGDQVENLTVTFDDGTVSLGGQVETLAAKQKAVLLAGNIKGVEKVDDAHLTVKPKPAAPPEPEFTFYEIKSGDSLSKIAKQYYGDAQQMAYAVRGQQGSHPKPGPDLPRPEDPRAGEGRLTMARFAT